MVGNFKPPSYNKITQTCILGDLHDYLLVPKYMFFSICMVTKNVIINNWVHSNTPLPMTPPAEAPVITSVLNGEDVSKEPSREPDTAGTQAPQALPVSHDKPLGITAAQGFGNPKYSWQ